MILDAYRHELSFATTASAKARTFAIYARATVEECRARGMQEPRVQIPAVKAAGVRVERFAPAWALIPAGMIRELVAALERDFASDPALHRGKRHP